MKSVIVFALILGITEISVGQSVGDSCSTSGQVTWTSSSGTGSTVYTCNGSPTDNNYAACAASVVPGKTPANIVIQGTTYTVLDGTVIDAWGNWYVNMFYGQGPCPLANYAVDKSGTITLYGLTCTGSPLTWQGYTKTYSNVHWAADSLTNLNAQADNYLGTDFMESNNINCYNVSMNQIALGHASGFSSKRGSLERRGSGAHKPQRLLKSTEPIETTGRNNHERCNSPSQCPVNCNGAPGGKAYATPKCGVNFATCLGIRKSTCCPGYTTAAACTSHGCTWSGSACS